MNFLEPKKIKLNVFCVLCIMQQTNLIQIVKMKLNDELINIGQCINAMERMEDFSKFKKL